MITERDQELAKTLVGNEIVESNGGYNLTDTVGRFSFFHNMRSLYFWLRSSFDYCKRGRMMTLDIQYGLSRDNPLLEQLWDALIEERLKEIQ